MTTIDFTKGIDFTPLEKLGIDKEDGAKLLTAFMPLIDIEFQAILSSTFSSDEMAKIGEEAGEKGIKPEDGSSFLEEKYFQKTGRYFMEEMRLLLNDYVVRSAAIIDHARKDTETFSSSGKDNNNRFEDLIKNKKWDDAAKLFDETVKKKEKS